MLFRSVVANRFCCPDLNIDYPLSEPLADETSLESLGCSAPRADGEVHQSLNASELLYLTLAYDWMLFRSVPSPFAAFEDCGVAL